MLNNTWSMPAQPDLVENVQRFACTEMLNSLNLPSLETSPKTVIAVHNCQNLAVFPEAPNLLCSLLPLLYRLIIRMNCHF